MTIAYLAGGVVVGVVLLFGWALGRVAAISDRRIEGSGRDRV